MLTAIMVIKGSCSWESGVTHGGDMVAITVLVAFLSILTGSGAKADDTNPSTNSTTMSIPAATAGTVGVPARADIDTEITNAHLRAATGSKSLYSIQSTFNYNGGSINNALGAERPQLSPGTIENDPAKLTGAVSVKYRASDHDNINLGVGVGWLTPTYAGQRGQVEDPYVGYSRVFKSGDIQNVFNTQITKYSADSSVKEGLNYELEADHTFLASIGKSKWQVGIDIAWTREFYTSTASAIQDELAAFPFVEYEFNRKFSFRTVYRGFTYYNTTDSAMDFQQDSITQSMGIGISIARDVYLYPNIQWVWTDMQAEKTNIALAANINLF